MATSKEPVRKPKSLDWFLPAILLTLWLAGLCVVANYVLSMPV